MHTALVLGSADCLWHDVVTALALTGFCPLPLIVACNDAGAAWPARLDHWTTLHPDKLDEWVRRRAAAHFTPAGQLWTYERGAIPAGLSVKRLMGMHGSSGMHAIRVAREAGATRILLCGMPMTETPHIPGLSWTKWHGGAWSEAHVFRPAWLAARHDLMATVRSMSGWTAEFLGAPTPEWLSA